MRKECKICSIVIKSIIFVFIQILIVNLGSLSLARADQGQIITPEAKRAFIKADFAELITVEIYFRLDTVEDDQSKGSELNAIREKYINQRDVNARNLSNLAIEPNERQATELSQTKLLHHAAINEIREKFSADIKSFYEERLDQRLLTTSAYLREYEITLLDKIYVLNGVVLKGEKQHLENFIDTYSSLIESVDIPSRFELFLDNSAPTVGFDTWWAEGVDGGTGIDFGLIDSGVNMTHPALNTHGEVARAGDLVTDIHGTAVASIAMSIDNPGFRGGASGADRIVWVSFLEPASAGVEWLMTNSADVVNMSLGNPTSNVDYGNTARRLDRLVVEYDTLIARAIGNGGWANSQTLATPYLYNDIAVAGMDDRNTISKADDRRLSGSSIGPTPSGRRKPDITAPARRILSANGNWDTTGQDDFITRSGTSYAAPHVAAAILLLRDQGVVNILEQKAVLINAADPWDSKGTADLDDDEFTSAPHWDKAYGWGYLNMDAAWDSRNNVDSSSLDSFNFTSIDDHYHLYKVNSSAVKTTLVWSKRNLTSTVGYDLSNLALDIYDETASGVSTAGTLSAVDNVLQLAATTNSNAVVKVEALDFFFDGASSEEFAIAMNQSFTRASPPEFDINIAHNLSVGANSHFSLSVSVKNNGDVASVDNTLAVTLPNGFSLVTGNLTRNLGTLSANQTKLEQFLVKATNATGSFSMSASNSSDSYGQTFTADDSSTINVNSTAPDLIVRSPPGVSDTTLTTGQGFTTSGVVENQGTGNSTATSLRYYYSTDSVIDTGDTQLSVDSVDLLIPGATTSKSNPATAPAIADTYWIGACVDAVSGESNTTNNCSTGVQVTVTAVAAPDLIVRSPLGVSNTTLTTGQGFTTSGVVENQGTGNSAATSLRYYYSTDSVIDTGDTQLSVDSIDLLIPGGLASKSNPATAPAIADTYWIGACVDAVSGESNTTNNCSTGVQVIVTAAGVPDLSYASHVIDDDTGGGSNGNDDGVPNKGEEIELDVTLINTGSLDATNVVGDLSTSESCITITDNNVSWGNIPQGSTDEGKDFDFIILSSCLVNQNVVFDLMISSSEGSWQDSLNIIIAEADSDGDGATDDQDNCPNDSNADQANNDMDAQGDVCDPDDDNDGMSDVFENDNGLDSLDASDAELDVDGDGLTNLEEFTINSLLDPNDPDTDGDGIDDALDNNPILSNNACSGTNATFDLVVTSDVICGADTSITVNAPAEVQNPGHLRLIAPAVIFTSGFRSGNLTVTSAPPCAACMP